MKTILIKSIGTANPNVSKILAEAFQINHEMLARLLYNAPAVFLEQADEAIANKALEILTQLGLEVELLEANAELPKKSEPLDLAVYVKDPLKMMVVAQQLSEFMGIAENDAMQLLLNEPSVVLGGVSLATAEVLKNRLDAEVIASNPKTDLYTIEITSDKSDFLTNFNAALKQVGIQPEKLQKQIENVSYEQTQALWKRFPNSKEFLIYNQSYQRHQIILEDFDLYKDEVKSFLTQTIGMPNEILADIHQNLPVVLDESVNHIERDQKLEQYQQNGLQCESKAIPFGKYKITVKNIQNQEKVAQVLTQFYKDAVIKNNTEKWTAPAPMCTILNRYLEKQLEFMGCEVEQEYV